MRLRSPLVSLLWIAGFGALAGRPFAAEPAPARPNIVIIYSDDVGYGDLGCYGATEVSTPNLDRLAAGGVRFTDAHAAASTCTPSRYSILTGRYAFREKRAQILRSDAPLIITPGQATLPGFLRQQGYATACIGKWHLGLGDGAVNWNTAIRPGPLEVGFDESWILPATPDRVPCVFVDGHNVVGLDQLDPLSISYQHPIGNEPTGRDHPEMLRYPADPQHSGTIVDRISRIGWMSGGRSAWWKDELISTTLVKKADDFMSRNRARPFFLYFAIHDVHVPRAPNERFLGTSHCGLRGDCIEELDWSVGEIVAELDRLHLRENTLIVFSSDNGPIFLDGYADGSKRDANGHTPAGPFRGGKYQIFEGGTRMPFIVQWPGRTVARVSGALVSQIDLFASLAAAIGVPLPKGAAPDSQNLLPVLLGRSDKGRDDLVEQAETLLALRQGQWKFVPAGPRPVWKALEEDDKSAGPLTPPGNLLYDLAGDIGETNNVAASRPDLVSQFAARLKSIRATP